MVINCYPVAGKEKSLRICAAFAAGAVANGVPAAVVHDGRWRPGPSMFYGVNDSNQACWEQALLNQQRWEWYYADNAYFDITRGTHFRVSKLRLQIDPNGRMSTGARLPPGLRLMAWNPSHYGHVLICPQSPDFMRRVVGYAGDWLADIKAQIQQRTPRRILVRGWDRNKGALAGSLREDLDGAYCLVTWSSAAANEALLAGIPVIVGSAQCAAWPFSRTVEDLDDEIMLAYPSVDRANWAGVLTDNQWTLEEIAQGLAFAALQGEQGNAATVVQDHPGD